MAAKIAKGAIRKSKPIASKTSLSSPYVKIWSPVVGEDMHFILQTLLEKFKQLELKRTQIRKKGKKSKKGGKNGEKEEKSAEAEMPKEEAQVPGWTQADLRKQLAIGINEVTRALERNDLSLVIVCKSAKPDIITKHIIELSHSRDVPACQLPRLSENMAPALGLTSMLALGFRRSSEVFREQVEAIVPRVPPLHVPWLQAAGGKGQEVGDLEEEPQEEEMEEEDGGAITTPSRKRKLSPATPQPGDVKLQELKVKKIVPNPNKKRKVKKSKKETAAAQK